MSKVKVAPSILSADFAKMAEAVQNLDKWHADVIHCDVMDGVFVPNITFGMDMIKALRKYTNGILDVHLMIIKPEKYIPQFIAAGADVITGEATLKADRYVVRRVGRRSGRVEDDKRRWQEVRTCFKPRQTVVDDRAVP